MVPTKLIHARIHARELSEAIQSQITLHAYGVTASFVAAKGAIGDAEEALAGLAKTMGFKLVALDSVREGSDQLEAAE
jgi:hypothetical protein